MNIPVPQHGSRVSSAVQQLINYVVHLIATLIGWQIDSLANIAAFATVDDTRIPDGSGKFVRTVKDTFHLDKTSVAVADGITVVATMSGAGRWVRDLQPNAVWGSQGTFYVDPLTGDDENLGTTDITALATFAEARRRLEPIGVLVPTTIYIVSSLAADDLVGMNCGGDTLTIQGLPTVVFTGELSNWTKDPAAGSGDPGHIDDATWTIADHLHEHVVFTDGAAAGMGCWILADDGAAGARVTQILADTKLLVPATANPGIGDAFTVQSSPTVTFDVVNYNGTSFDVFYVNSADTVFVRAPYSSFVACKSMFVTYSSIYFAVVDCLGSFSTQAEVSYAVAGGFKSMAVISGSLTTYHPITFDVAIPASAGIGLALIPTAYARLLEDVYFFGAFTPSPCVLLNSSTTLRMDSKVFRGDNTGSIRLIQVFNNTLVQSTSNSHNAVVTTGLLAGSNVAFNMTTDVPVYDPHYDARVGMNATKDAGAIGSHTAGIKGAIGAATVFALPDFTSSATDDLPLVVTNRSIARNLRCRLGTAPGGADTVTVTVFLGPAGGPGVVTVPAITVTFGPAETFKQDIVNAVLVDPGEELSFQVVSSGIVAADLSIALEAG